MRVLQKALRGEKVTTDGLLVLAGKEQTLIRVSPSSRDRALRIFDGLFNGLVARGHDVTAKVHPGQYYSTCSLAAAVGGQLVDITLKERLRQSDHVPARDESFAPKYDFAPSGELSLRVGERYGRCHRIWTDGAWKNLDGRLGEVVLGIEEVARLKADETRRRQGRWRLEAEQQRQRELAEHRERHEQSLRKDLSEMAAAWRESRNLRAFLAAVEEGAPEHRKTDGFRAWIAWARAHIEDLDPLLHPERVAKVVEPKPLAASAGVPGPPR